MRTGTTPAGTIRLILNGRYVSLKIPPVYRDTTVTAYGRYVT